MLQMEGGANSAIARRGRSREGSGSTVWNVEWGGKIYRMVIRAWVIIARVPFGTFLSRVYRLLHPCVTLFLSDLRLV
jgi:hypothetical protein